jgi:hypothetical protein
MKKHQDEFSQLLLNLNWEQEVNILEDGTAATNEALWNSLPRE